MEINEICLNCFKYKGEYDVCMHCGYHQGTPPEQAYHLFPGTILNGRYVVGTTLGFGGFGVTYRAWDANLSTVVAIKEFYPVGLVSRIPGETNIMVFSGEKSDNFAHQMQRFLDEAKNLAKFNNDSYIVNVYDFFNENNTAYIVMEYLDGLDLKDYMVARNYKMEETEAVYIAKSVLYALEQIHSKGIIHRDISPDNIFVLNDGRIKLLDFGAAKFDENESADVMRSIVIKMGYAPPEQYRSNMPQGAWTDIYAVGATIYKMITGITPEESVDRMEDDEVKRPSQLGFAITPQTDKIIMKAMALNIEQRFKSAADMLEAFEGNLKTEYPDVEIKKAKNKRVATVAVTFACIAFVGLGIFGAYKMLDKKKPFFDPKALSADSIEYLVPVSNIDEETELYENLISAFTEQYSDFEVNVNLISSKDYNNELKTLYASGEAPDIFRSDEMVFTEEGIKPLNLSELYSSLDKSKYALLDNASIEKYYPAKDRVPTCFNYLTGYVNSHLSETMSVFTDITQLNLLELAESGELSGKNSPYYVYVSPRDLGKVLNLHVDNLIEQFDNEINDDFIKVLEAFYNGYFSQELPTEDIYAKLLENDELICYVDSTSKLSKIQKLMPGYYKTFPVVNDKGFLTGSYSGNHSINAETTENKQKISMLFISYLLSDYGQNTMYVQTGKGIPLFKPAMETYFSLYSDFADCEQKITKSQIVMDGENEYNVDLVGEYFHWFLVDGHTLDEVLGFLKDE